MSHSHDHPKGSKNILIAFFLNASFAVIELIGGYLTNSVAIYSDALHDIGDSIALLFAYFAEKLSYKKADAKFTYGYRRFSVLSALINGVILFAGSIFILVEAIKRITAPEPVIPEGMLALAVLGIVVNGIAAYRLSKDKGANQRMIMFHLWEDILGWCSVLVVSIVLLFKPWYVLDSILSILISLVILRGVYKNLIKVGEIFLQKFPESLKISEIENKIKTLPLVEDVHAIKGWSLDEDKHYLSFHVGLPEGTTIKDIDSLKLKIKEILMPYNIEHSTIEFESYNEGLCSLD